MKNLRTLLAAAALLTLATPPPAAQAQNYRPFGPGRTYHFRESASQVGAADSLYTFRVDSVGVSAGDSVFYVNRTLPPGNGGGVGGARRVNLFGGWLRWHDSTGTATIGTADTSATVELRTRAPLNTPWPFTANLTAMVTGRSVGRILGRVDTLLSVRISDGRTLLIGRKLGIIDGVNLDYYLGRSYLHPLRRRVLTLDAIPEVQAAAADLRWEGVWNLQPGDSLFYTTKFYQQNNAPMPVVRDSSARGHERLRIVQRRLAATADTLWLQLVRTSNAVGYSNATWSGSGSNVFYHPADTLTLRVLRAEEPRLLTASFANLIFVSGPVLPPYSHPDSLGGVVISPLRLQQPDARRDLSYAAGLGIVYDQQSFGGAADQVVTRRLIGYSKSNGAVRWGNTAAPQPLATPTALPATVAAALAPNPAPVGTAAALFVALDRPQTVRLTLYDGLGRVVWQQQPALAAGAQQLLVATGAPLAPGLYRLRLTLADGRQRVLPLMRE